MDSAGAQEFPLASPNAAASPAAMRGPKVVEPSSSLAMPPPAMASVALVTWFSMAKKVPPTIPPSE